MLTLNVSPSVEVLEYFHTYLEKVYYPGKAKDVGDCKKTFGNERRVVLWPILAQHFAVTIVTRLDLRIIQNTKGNNVNTVGKKARQKFRRVNIHLY